MDLDESTREQYKLPKSATGTVVADVQPGSVAASLGLKRGDVIESVGGKPVANGQELKDAMAGVKWGDRVRIRTVRYANGTRQDATRDVLFK